jgi:hypothetical protein
MHDAISSQNPSRRRRRTLVVLAVAGGTYGAYQAAVHARPRQQSRGEGQAPMGASQLSASLWWSGVMLLLYRAVRTAAESTPVPRPPCNAPRSRAQVGEHTQWLETFRTEQSRRLRSDPPAD